MNPDYFVIIMAGGIGSRFWPFSRTSYPKQFHDIMGVGKTMLQQTAERFEDICPRENIYVVTNYDYYQLVKDNLPYLSDDQILLEPVARNTAPCIAYASYKISRKNKNASMVVTPSDHVVLKDDIFKDTILKALEGAQNKDILITLGIKPSRPDTGYGYIQYLEDESSELKKVKTFTEKPHEELAKQFIESGDFVWNAGLFVWNINTILNSFEVHLPDMAEIFINGLDKFYQDEEQQFINNAYAHCKNISIDYGIMEHAEDVYVILSDFGWTDLGTWKSLYEVQDKDENQNVLDGNIMTYDTANSIVKTPKDKLVVLEGLNDYIVAEFDNVLMICRKGNEQKVKEFVADIKADKDKNSRYI